MNIATVTQPPFALRSCAAVNDYWALTKPEINFLIAIATLAGFYLVCLLSFMASRLCCWLVLC
jgi:heme O synthase-like polyprenyltransferase